MSMDEIMEEARKDLSVCKNAMNGIAAEVTRIINLENHGMIHDAREILLDLEITLNEKWETARRIKKE